MKRPCSSVRQMMSPASSTTSVLLFLRGEGLLCPGVSLEIGGHGPGGGGDHTDGKERRENQQAAAYTGHLVLKGGPFADDLVFLAGARESRCVCGNRIRRGRARQVTRSPRRGLPNARHATSYRTAGPAGRGQPARSSRGPHRRPPLSAPHARALWHVRGLPCCEPDRADPGWR